MKIVVLIPFLLIANASIAQLQKSKVLVGGAFSLLDFNSRNHYSPANHNLSASTQLEASPQAGLFLTNRSVLGLAVGFSYGKTSYPYEDTPMSSFKQSLFSVKPFYRYYFPLGEKVSFYLHSSAGVSFGEDDQRYAHLDEYTGLVTSLRQKSKIRSQHISLQPGFAFFINTRWSVEATVSSLEYAYIINKLAAGNSKSTSNQFGFDYNAFNFGVTAYLGKN